MSRAEGQWHAGAPQNQRQHDSGNSTARANCRQYVHAVIKGKTGGYVVSGHHQCDQEQGGEGRARKRFGVSGHEQAARLDESSGKSQVPAGSVGHPAQSEQTCFFPHFAKVPPAKAQGIGFPASQYPIPEGLIGVVWPLNRAASERVCCISRLVSRPTQINNTPMSR